MYEYLFPLSFTFLLLSLIFSSIRIFAKSDKDKYDTWHEMLHAPMLVSLLIGVVYYWISPLTAFGEKLTVLAVFVLAVLAGPVSGMYMRTQIQRYVHYLLEITTLLALLWIIFS